MAVFLEHLVHAKKYCQLIYAANVPMRRVLLYPHCTSWESERLSDWFKVTQLMSDRARIRAQAAQLQSLHS